MSTHPDLERAFSIDVECVANGVGHLARTVAQVALVDANERILVNILVLPDQPILSCLPACTGLSLEILQTQGRPLLEALQILRHALPPQAVLIGQGIQQDVQWLDLKEGVDFQSMIDLAGLYRVWNDRYKTWSVWGQDYLCAHVLGWDVSSLNHNAALDAQKSMRLYKRWLELQADPMAWQLVQENLLAGKPQPSFAKRNPTYDGVCMGNRKTCTCGDPFFT